MAKKNATKKKTSKPAATKKLASRKVAAKQKPAVKSKALAKKKAPAKKVAARKPVTKKPVAKKRPVAKKEVVAGKKAPAKKATAEPKAPLPPPTAKQKRRGRITKMTVEEALISLSTLEGKWADVAWLQGLVLYGSTLRSAAFHREFSFMVLYKGMRAASKLRAAQAELDELIKNAVPIPRKLHLIGDLPLLDKIQADDPAVRALFGELIIIYAR